MRVRSGSCGENRLGVTSAARLWYTEKNTSSRIQKGGLFHEPHASVNESKGQSFEGFCIVKTVSIKTNVKGSDYPT